MSNNRKRNMRKLARNIITGTALAVGGLTQTSATDTQMDNSGGLNAGTAASIGVSTLVGLTGIGVGYLQYKGNKELAAKGNAESARHNKWVEDSKKAEKDIEEKKIMKDDKAKELCVNVNSTKSKVGNLDMLLPEDVNHIMREGNRLQKDILLELAGGWDAQHRANAANIAVEAVLSDKSGKKLTALVDKMCDLTFATTSSFANNVCAVIHTGNGTETRANLNARIDTPTTPPAPGAAGYAHVLHVGRKVTKTETAPFDEVLGPTLKKLLGGTVACRFVLVPHNLDHGANITDSENVHTSALTGVSDPFTCLYTSFINAHANLTKDNWLNNNQVGIMFDTGATTTRNGGVAAAPDVISAGGLAEGYRIIKLTDAALGKIDKDVVKELRRKISLKYWDFCDKAITIEDQERNVEELNA